MRTIDEISEAFAHATSDAERKALELELEQLREYLAKKHLDAGHIAEYQSVLP